METIRNMTLTLNNNNQLVGKNSIHHTDVCNTQEQKWWKLSIPVSEEDDAYGWVNRVEH